MSSSAPSQAAILVLQKTMSEQDRRLLLLWMSVLQQQQKAKQAIRLSLTEKGLCGSPALQSGSGPGAALRAHQRAELERLKPGVRSLPSSLTRPRIQHPLSTHRCPNLSCSPADKEQRLSKQELVRQQIAQETFPNELEGLVPSPRAVALLS